MKNLFDECLVKSDDNGKVDILIHNDKNVPLVLKVGQKLSKIKACMVADYVEAEGSASVNVDEKVRVNDNCEKFLYCKMFKDEVLKIIYEYRNAVALPEEPLGLKKSQNSISS